MFIKKAKTKTQFNINWIAEYWRCLEEGRPVHLLLDKHNIGRKAQLRLNLCYYEG